MDETPTHHGRLSAATYDALEQLQANGVKVIPVTAAPAGCCDQMARMWPVDGVIGGNGGFFFRRQLQGHALEGHFWHSSADQVYTRDRLEEIADIARTKWGTGQARRRSAVPVDQSGLCPAGYSDRCSSHRCGPARGGSGGDGQQSLDPRWLGRVEDARSLTHHANGNAAATALVAEDMEAAMRRIENCSREISTILGVINEIAFQTDLLALNAGVEAARAGDSGKGFAVAAHEVRELPRRSACAGEEIKILIDASTSEIAVGVTLADGVSEQLCRQSPFPSQPWNFIWVP
ncbi:methyl-accepting chemotaxis protein [Rhizobium sp. 007]|uniref:methyl-accepting chemotaxis protein n=1 Tax=Rhizobium sp. 007 TaxID=2785056 RepID=UPI002485E744|nr:methyl-accepting chemotaxis protein [Rhizobium sp. 007]